MRSLSLFVALLALVGCRQSLGTPDYSSHVGLVPDAGSEDAGASDFLEGSEPYLTGAKRLSIGIFYEGGYSERIELSAESLCLDEARTVAARCYYIFEAGSALTYTQDTTSDRLEGTLADRFTLTGTSYWGGGVIWDEATDLSRWSTLAFSLKSSGSSFSEVQVTMQSGADEVTAVAVDASDYGFASDGEWHHLTIPLDDFVGLDLSAVRAPFVLGGTGNSAGDQLLVDEVYLTQD